MYELKHLDREDNQVKLELYYRGNFITGVVGKNLKDAHDKLDEAFDALYNRKLKI